MFFHHLNHTCSLSPHHHTSCPFPAISHSIKPPSLQSEFFCTTFDVLPFVLNKRTSQQSCALSCIWVHITPITQILSCLYFEHLHFHRSWYLHRPLLLGGWLCSGFPPTSPFFPPWQINSLCLRRGPDKRGVDFISVTNRGSSSLIETKPADFITRSHCKHVLQ